MTFIIKLPLSPIFGVLLCVLLTISGQRAAGYDSPNFDYTIVDTDALNLSQNDRESLVEALNAVACNFPASQLVDDDLKEKALALALALDPLNVNSRNAHFALMGGSQPSKTAFFQSSVSEVAENLWATADRMSGKGGEPEGRKLAKYLQELSLVLHPSPPLDRIRIHARQTDDGGGRWEKFLTLQPGENPSNAKLKALLEEAKSNKKPEKTEVPTPPKSIPETAARKVPPAPVPPKAARSVAIPAQGNATVIKLKKVEFPFVVQTRATVQNGNLGGIASIHIKKASAADEGLFGVTAEIGPDRAYQMRIVGDPDGFQPSGFESAEQMLRRTFPNWPERVLAEIRFDSDLPSRSSRRLTSVDTSLAASLLLHSVFSGETPVPGLVCSGFIADISPQGEPTFSMGDEIAAALDQAKAMKAEFLLVPDAQYNQFVKGAIETRMLEYLFDPQLISYSSWDQLKDTVYGAGAEARTAASAEFKKIQAVQDKMTLVDLARNEKVRERLTKIVADYPQHLSARVMLAFGSAPDDKRAVIKDSVRGIDEAIAPFITSIAESVEDDSMIRLDFDEMKPMLEQADRMFAAMQSSIVPEVRNYLYLSRGLLDVTNSLVSSSSKDSSAAHQRLEVVKKAFGALQMERAALGLERIEAGGLRRLRRPMRL